MSSTSSERVFAAWWPLAIAGLLVLFGAIAWTVQLSQGLAITGLGRDVSWGLYISQLTFFVGVAASAVMVAIPYYLHDFKPFGDLLLLGEALAVACVVAAGLFVLVDLGQPLRALNVLRYPSPRSPMFWDMASLMGYLAINATLFLSTLWARRAGQPLPRWFRPLVLLSIPWAISIHTVTAFLYSGLPGRPLWETAVLAPRFLASAFASGPSLLLLIVLALRANRAPEALRALSRVVAWALAANAFLFGVELFTALYSHDPAHLQALRALFLEPASGLAPYVWGSQILCAVAFILLLRSSATSRGVALASGLAFAGVWLEKGMGLIPGGLMPSALGEVAGYRPTLLEWLITAGVWGLGALVFLGGLALIHPGSRTWAATGRRNSFESR